MKHTIRHLTAVLLCLVLVLSDIIPVLAANSPDIPYGKDIGGYDPLRDGYYGLLPLRYEPRRDESYGEGEGRTMQDVYLPVLVYQNTVFVRSNDFATIFGGVAWTLNDPRICELCIESRQLFLAADSKYASYTQGEFRSDDGIFASMKVTLTAAPKLIDNELWLPLDDLAVIFGMSPSVQGEGEEARYQLFHVERDALDVLAKLSTDADAYLCDMAVWHDYGAGFSSSVGLYLDGLLKMESTNVKMLLKTMTFQNLWAHYDPMEDWYSMLTGDVADMIVLAGADEAYESAKSSYSASSELLSLTQTAFQNRGKITTSAVLPLMGKIRGTDTVNKLGKLIAQMEDPINSKALQKISDASGFTLTAFGAGLSWLGNCNAFTQRDNLGQLALERMLKNGTFEYSDPANIAKMRQNMEEYQNSAKKYALGKAFKEDGVGTAADFLGAGNAALSAYKIASVCFPHLKGMEDAARSFQDASVAFPLQLDARDNLLSVLQQFDGASYTDREFEQALLMAYCFLKICYVTARLADQTIFDQNFDRSDLDRHCELLLKDMSILINAYDPDALPQNLGLRMSEVTAGAPYQLTDIVIKMYVTVKGKVLEKGEEETPVTDAECRITCYGEEIGRFSGTDSQGSFTVHIPIFHADTIRTSIEDLNNLKISLLFKSPTVKGNGYADFDFRPGAEIDVGIVYLESHDQEMVCSAPIAEYEGTEYVIPVMSGAGPLEGLTPLPVKCPALDHICSFAFYNGKLYVCCKEDGVGDYRTALFECNPDGTEMQKLAEGQMPQMSRFVIKDGTLYYLHVQGMAAPNIRSFEYAIDLETKESRTVIDGSNVMEEGAQEIARLMGRGQLYNNGYYYYVADAMPNYSHFYWGHRIVRYEGTEAGAVPGVQEIVLKEDEILQLEGVTGNHLYYSTDSDNTFQVFCIDLEPLGENDTKVGGRPNGGVGSYFYW